MGNGASADHPLSYLKMLHPWAGVPAGRGADPPLVDWRRQGLRRFGFHGLSHQHVAEVVAARMPPAAAANPLRLISCHLGAGCSLCAIAAGRSVDTTMGFTPLEGLVMATRCGSVDPGLLLHQLRRGLSVEELDQALNGHSGLLALSELSGSMLEIRAAAAAGHEGALLAIAVFRHRLLREIGAMAASLGGVDVLAFTGGIGEHDDAPPLPCPADRESMCPTRPTLIGVSP